MSQWRPRRSSFFFLLSVNFPTIRMLASSARNLGVGVGSGAVQYVGLYVGFGDGSGVGSGVTTAPAHVIEMAEFDCQPDPAFSFHVPETAVRSSSGSALGSLM